MQRVFLLDEAIYRTLVGETKAKLEKWKDENKQDIVANDSLLYDVQRLVAAGLLWGDVLACFKGNAGYFGDNARERYDSEVYESMKHIRKEGTRKKRVTEEKLGEICDLAEDIETFNIRKEDVLQYLQGIDFRMHDPRVSPKYRALTRINKLIERKVGEISMIGEYINTINAYVEKQSYEKQGSEAIQSIPVIFVTDECLVGFRK